VKGPGAAPGEPSLRETELVTGLRAGLSVVARRPEDVLRGAYLKGLDERIAPLLALARRRGMVVEPTGEAELDRLAGAPQHEGLVLWTRPRRWIAPRDLGVRLLETQGVAIAFDRVRNPYNVGAILRSAAFFGATGALFGPMAPAPTLSPLAVRVAEGGVEHLALARTTDLGASLRALREAGVAVVGADGRANTGVDALRRRRPTVLVVGHEREGLSAHVRQACDLMVAVGGTGAVESLNVSIAASVLLHELLRRP
jgi:TrmH RNA methyltransferase